MHPWFLQLIHTTNRSMTSYSLDWLWETLMVQWTALGLKQSEHNSDWKLLTNITKRPRQDSRKKNSLSARKCTTFVVFSSLPRNFQFNVTAKNKYAVALKIGLDLSRMYELRGYVEIIVLRICFRISIFSIHLISLLASSKEQIWWRQAREACWPMQTLGCICRWPFVL